jgi:hypothetical protein
MATQATADQHCQDRGEPAAVAVMVPALAAGLPVLAAAAVVTVLVLGMICWVIADAGRARNAAELLRAARGEPPAASSLRAVARSGPSRQAPRKRRRHPRAGPPDACPCKRSASAGLT